MFYWWNNRNIHCELHPAVYQMQYNKSKEGNKPWEGWKECLTRSGWGLYVFFWFGEKEGNTWPFCSVQFPGEEEWEVHTCLFSLWSNFNTRSKLHQGRVTLDVRKHFFNDGVIKSWNRFSREVVDTSGLGYLDNAHSNMI